MVSRSSVSLLPCLHGNGLDNACVSRHLHSAEAARSLPDGCACTQLPEGTPPGETRIYRFYESYEVLTHLRIWHKMFFTPHRHVHEIRFAFERSPNLVSQHSMVSLAMSLTEDADTKSPDDYARPWYTGEGKTCTGKFESLHQQSCQVAVKASDWNLCPP
jgi:hypothetical protein